MDTRATATHFTDRHQRLQELTIESAAAGSRMRSAASRFVDATLTLHALGGTVEDLCAQLDAICSGKTPTTEGIIFDVMNEGLKTLTSLDKTYTHISASSQAMRNSGPVPPEDAAIAMNATRFVTDLLGVGPAKETTFDSSACISNGARAADIDRLRKEELYMVANVLESEPEHVDNESQARALALLFAKK